MIKKFEDFCNENIFLDRIGHNEIYKRKEDNIRIKEEWIISRKNYSDYYIENGLVCCKGDVVINDNDLVDGKLPVKFGKVEGKFDCSGCYNLTSLEGCPNEVGGYFDCGYCPELTSLEGCPKDVDGHFSCIECKKLTSLEGCPEYVGSSFYCSYCSKFTSLVGCPEKVSGDFMCNSCKNLTSLEGCPKEVCNDFYCADCGKTFMMEDVKSKCSVKGKIFVEVITL